MKELPIPAAVTALLEDVNARGGYPMSILCTREGLLFASAGEGVDADELAGFTSLFDDLVVRATRDLSFGAVDEMTLLDPGRGRYILRPIAFGAEHMFLVVKAPHRATWRKNTNKLCSDLARILAPMSEDAP